MYNKSNQSFWSKIIISGSGVSSKRLMGIVCIGFAIVFACLGIVLGDSGTVDGMVSTVIIEFLATGVALFGITGWERRKTPYNPPLDSSISKDDTYDIEEEPDDEMIDEHGIIVDDTKKEEERVIDELDVQPYIAPNKHKRRKSY